MEPASDTGGGAMDDSPAVLDGAPGGSEGGGESDGAGPPASIGFVPCRPRQMALRLSSSRGRPRRCMSYMSRSFSACSCSLRSSRRRFSSSSLSSSA
eukprot:scaffold138755_cov96-Phaeocystis_antarctica.AAC.1